MEEVKQDVSGPAVVAGVHCHLSEEILYVLVFCHQGSQPVPEIVQGVDALSPEVGALVVRLYERPSKLYCPGEVFLLELLRECKNLSSCHFLRRQGAADDIAVAADYLLVILVPDNQLFVGVSRIGVELVYIAGLSRAAATEPEGYFAEPSNLPHGERRVLGRHFKYQVVSLACLADELFGSKLSFDELSIYCLNYCLHNCKRFV